MFKCGKIKSFANRFKKDENGTMVVMWATSLMAIILAIGAAYDLSKVKTGEQKAQHAADMLSLAAAAYLRENDGQPPTNPDEGFLEGVVYKLSDFGIQLIPYTDMSQGEDGGYLNEPTFTIDYGNTPLLDDEGEPLPADEQPLLDDELKVTISAVSIPTFMRIAGINSVPLEVLSTAGYAKEDLKDPASIFFILDNSGSMARDDDGNHTTTESEKRIYALRESMKNFMTKMDTITSDNDRILRTAMWAFSHDNYSTVETETIDTTCTGTRREQDQRLWRWKYSRRNGWYKQYYWTYKNVPYTYSCTQTNSTTVPVTNSKGIVIDTETPPDWGTIATTTIDALEPYAWTDPDKAIAEAKSFMALEQAVHEAQNSDPEIEVTPHKFVIIMTDGAIMIGGSSSANNAEEAKAQTQCTALKNDDVTVYTIGYGIDHVSDEEMAANSSLSKSDAQVFLEDCATDDKFYLATDANVLERTFDDIGEDILEEIIRLRS